MAFVKATKEQAKLRLALFGPSGSGKTFTSLRIATGIGGPIALVDSERRTARKYSDRFDFAVEELEDKSIDSYCKVIREAGEGKFNVLIIDSLSHAWQELLADIDKLAATKFRGNTWSAWSEGTPKQRMLVDVLLDSPCHIIATMRSKTEWVQETGHNGKAKPVKVGLAPEQGKGIEYEFDMLMELSTEHVATVSKDRTGQFQDKLIEKPGEKFGEELKAWLGQGTVPQKAAVLAAVEHDEMFRAMLDKAFQARKFAPDEADAAIADVMQKFTLLALSELPVAKRAAFIAHVEKGGCDKFKFNGKVPANA